MMEKIKSKPTGRHQYYIVLGDWSNDGHGKTEKVLIESNIPVEDLRKAFLLSTENTDIAFFDCGNKIEICVQYEASQLKEHIFSALTELGCPMDEMGFDGVGDDELTEDNCEDCYFCEESYLNVLMWFIGLSIEGTFVWKKIKDEISVFNGYWTKDLNVQLGYGLYE